MALRGRPVSDEVGAKRRCGLEGASSSRLSIRSEPAAGAPNCAVEEALRKADTSRSWLARTSSSALAGERAAGNSVALSPMEATQSPPTKSSLTYERRGPLPSVRLLSWSLRLPSIVSSACVRATSSPARLSEILCRPPASATMLTPTSRSAGAASGRPGELTGG
eukprot:scaffold233605_cov23-Tisochrysis_lutea.AAC.2